MLKEGDYFKVTTISHVWLGIKDNSEELTGCKCCVCIYDNYTGLEERELWGCGIIYDDATMEDIVLATPEEIKLFDDILACRLERTYGDYLESKANIGLKVFYNKETKQLEPITNN